MTATQVLQLDATGFPQSWISCEDAALYYATGSVAWTLGEVMHTLRGGYNAGMKLLFTPYVPSIFEAFILRGRNISGDAHAYLAKRVSKNSRWRLSGAIV